MLLTLDQSVEFIVDDEGPELNVSPDEPGGASRYGISLLALGEDMQARGINAKPTIQTLKDMLRADAIEFYKRKAVHLNFEKLPSGIDYVVLNSAVTLGPTGAALTLQMCIDMWPTTGKIDTATIEAVPLTDPKIIIHSMCSAWLAWKARSGPNSWTKYGHGWTNRDKRVRIRALTMLGA